MDNIIEARTQFRSIDTNGNGSLDLGELSNGLSEFGLTDAGIEAIFFDLDVNNDRQVTEEEYVATSFPGLKSAQDKITEEVWKKVLLEDLSEVESKYHADKQLQVEAKPSNRTASNTWEEASWSSKTHGRADAKATFKALDTDGNGNW